MTEAPTGQAHFKVSYWNRAATGKAFCVCDEVARSVTSWELQWAGRCISIDTQHTDLFVHPVTTLRADIGTPWLSPQSQIAGSGLALVQEEVEHSTKASEELLEDMEERANPAVARTWMFEGDQEFVEKLEKKHGNNFAAMARDGNMHVCVPMRQGSAPALGSLARVLTCMRECVRLCPCPCCALVWWQGSKLPLLCVFALLRCVGLAMLLVLRV
jgi:hypothetical protein